MRNPREKETKTYIVPGLDGAITTGKNYTQVFHESFDPLGFGSTIEAIITDQCSHCGNASDLRDCRGNCVACGAPRRPPPNPRLILKSRLLMDRLCRCDGKHIKPHKCEPKDGLDLHEALYSRGDLPKSKQGYAFDEHNVLLLCRWFHERYGKSKWLRQKAAELLCTYYSSEAIQFYLENAPLKKPLLLEQLLWGVEPEPEV